MIAATSAVQRPPDAKLLVVNASGGLKHADREAIVDHLRPHDLLLANDAATIPASLPGVHEPSGEEIEIRLAGRRSLAFDDVRDVAAGARPRRPPLARPTPRHRAAIARAPAPACARLRRQTGGDLGRDRPPRPADPVGPSRRAPGAVGRLDTRRVAAGLLRAALGRVSPRLEPAHEAAAERDPIRHADSRRRTLLHGRRRARPQTASGRAVPHPGGHGGGDRTDRRRGRARHCPRHHRDSRRGARGVGRRTASRHRRCDAAHRTRDRAARDRRHRQRRPRTGQEPLRATPRLRRRYGAAADEHHPRGAQLPDARVR